MARTKLEMKGLESVIKDLNKLGKSISTPIKTGMTKATNKCKRLAKEECPTNKDLKITKLEYDRCYITGCKKREPKRNEINE